MMGDAGTPLEDAVDDAPLFPSPGDKLFPAASVASTSARSTGQSWYDYTTGYKEAADVLVAHIETTARGYAKLRYPILFLYRHHLELVVKGLIRECCSSLGRDADSPKHHFLDQLWRRCVQLLREISPAASASEINETTRLFDELCKIDPASNAFRYPEDRSGNESVPPAIDVDLSGVRDVVERISFFLDCVSTSLQAERDAF